MNNLYFRERSFDFIGGGAGRFFEEKESRTEFLLKKTSTTGGKFYCTYRSIYK